MIELEFKPDDEEIQSCRRTDPTKERLGVLLQTYFDMPVRLAINGTELLTSPGDQRDCWWYLPLLNVAIVLMNRIIRARQNGNSYYDMPGSGEKLYFVREDQQVRITSRANGITELADYEELIAACNAFASRVREYLLSEFPGFAEHPKLAPWFQGVLSLEDV